MAIQAYAISDPGTSRKTNEDNWLIDSDLALCIVSDGNTHPRGAFCSDRVCKGIQKFLRENRALIDAHQRTGSSADRLALIELIRQAIETVSSTLYLQARQDSEMTGMIATVCLVLVSRGFAFIGHLGDSRAYSIREDAFHLLTRDHTFLASMLAEGKSLEEARKVIYAGHLSAAMGYQPVARATVQARELATDERILLCTDGLSDMLGPGSFRASLWAKAESAKLPELLREHALKKQARDNLTAVVIEWDHRKIDSGRMTRNVSNKLGTLRGIRLFQHFGERSMMKLLSLSDTRELEPGETLIQRGGILHEMFIILSGELSIDLGQGAIGATVKKGEVVGEMSLFEGSLPSATLTTRAPTTVLSLHRDRLFQVMREDIEFAARFELGVLQAVIRRLRERTEPDHELKHQENYSVVSILPPESN